MLTKQQIESICYEYIVPKWYSMPDTFPDFLQIFSNEAKKTNETFLKKHIPEFQKTLSSYAKQPSETKKKEIKGVLYRLAETENILQIKEHVTKELSMEFEENIESFLEKVRSFDETLSRENIWQAMRNYLIYSIIVNLQGEKQNCRDTILGYSLLYPYTDNYIDELQRNPSDKNSYNDLIRKTLLREEINPKNAYEEKTKHLLKLVLNHYSDEPAKQKNASFFLLLMLEAQEQSILQIRTSGTKQLTTEDILHITTYKGGLSVLIDYLFSIEFDASTVTEDSLRFYLSLGFILQLVDDLQDIAEDQRNHLQTLPTTCKNKIDLEKIVNQLLHFTQTTIANFSPKNPELHAFILQNCLLIILISVVQNAEYYSESYLQELESYLPFSISFFLNYKAKIKNN